MTDPAPTAPDLRLVDYRPRSRLRRPAHEVPRPRFPAIDVHNHLGSVFAGGWPERDASQLAAVLDQAGVERFVDLDGGWGEHLERELEHWQTPHDGRVAVFCGLDYDAWATERDFGELEAARLRAGIAAGARGLKAWKPLGLTARDPDGRLVPVGDERLDPLWAAAGELDVPVLIHIADPIAFFDPLDETNERWEELEAHPDWHFWPTRPPNRPDLDGFPPFDELIDGLEQILARHPGTTFIGAHVGCAPEDLDRVSGMLERYPNFNVDIAARLAELGRQPYTARAFIVRWADRVLFGTDMEADPRTYAIHYRFLETFDESFDYDPGPVPPQGRWQIHGLGLPDDVLEQVYAGNARRLVRWTR